jgi:hypothetical protein
MTKPKQKRLLVEGKDDLHVIVNLLKPHIGWEENSRPIEITDCKGEELLDDETIPAWLKTSNDDTKILGIVLDADGNCRKKWQRVRQLCDPHVGNIPEDIPPRGWIVPTKREKQLGVWIMPNNQHPGMLEIFLKTLVPERYACLLSYAEIASKRAKARFGAPYGDTHHDKAVMHTWLAWMEPPGRPFGTAFLTQILDAKADTAEPFLNWFRDLYEFNSQPVNQ